ncbi:MAG: DnaJ domain-containing protein [Spirochaetaceae bacterium]|nr:DnaJ domain-containing protein [Spirochaetaceae bacterium]
MDRYYRILGIPNNSSKEVIKKSYHAKMKTLHPDKIHGTPLEDTATFFAIEINEAYTNLMKQFKNNTSSASQNNHPSFLEEEIYIEGKGYLKYTLSNNLNVIINEIYNRVHHTVPDSPSQIPWNINSALSPDVKKIMNKHNLNYSMTSFWEGSMEFVFINKRSGSNWYIAGYKIFSQPKKQTASSQTYYNSNQYNTSYSKDKNPFWVFVKIVIAVAIFGIIFQQCNNQQPTGNQSRTTSARTAQMFATVVSCDWLNVRRTPSSVNNNNIIEAIRVNTRVEVLERTNNGWVRIRYGNGKTGYVHSNFLSR